MIILIFTKIFLYTGEGAWQDGITALISFANHYNLEIDTGGSIKINDINYINKYKIIIVPGGYAETFDTYINRKILVKYVKNGGAYFGICAGSYFVSKYTLWNDTLYIRDNFLFNGYAIGPINSIAPWPTFALSKITTPDTLHILYYGGPYFKKDLQEFDSIANYSKISKSAIITFTLDSGKVLLCGVHPEIEENSDRDNTNFAQGLNDPETDWPFLKEMIDFLLDKHESIIEKQNIHIEYKDMYNICGRKINMKTNGIYFKNRKKILYIE